MRIGSVSIRIGNEALYDGCVTAIIKAAKLPAGDYSATAVFYGDDNYENQTLDDIMFTVSRLTPTIDVDIDDLTYPKVAYAIVNIGNNANGTVNVTVDKRTFGSTVSNGYANVSISGLSAGYKNAKIEFFSRDYYNNDVNASSKFVVYPNNSNIVVDSRSTFYVGDDIEIKVKTYNSTGDLTVYINGEKYGGVWPYIYDRNYDIHISDKFEGTYVIDFRLDNDENYTGSQSSTTVYVTKKDVSIEVIDIDEVIRVNDPVTFTAKLNSTVSGIVIFTINGANYTEYVNNGDMVTHLYTPANNDIVSL